MGGAGEGVRGRRIGQGSTGKLCGSDAKFPGPLNTRSLGSNRLQQLVFRKLDGSHASKFSLSGPPGPPPHPLPGRP